MFSLGSRALSQTCPCRAETGIFSQWFHQPYELYYARWNQGEVDIVGLTDRQRPNWAVEVKWSDRVTENTDELASLISFSQANRLQKVLVTTRTVSAVHTLGGIEVEFVPASVYCYTLGYNIIRGLYTKRQPAKTKEADEAKAR